MTDTYNIRDSYIDYKKRLLKDRLDKVTPSAIKDRIKLRNYERLPIKHIERLETKYNVVPEVKDPGMTVYINIVHGYLKFIMRKVFEGNDIRLGAKLGIVGIRGKKIKPEIGWDGKVKGLAPSWGKTKVKWTEEAAAMGLTFEQFLEKVPKKDRKLVFCFNEHTEYVRYRIVWYKKNVIVENKTFYGLTFNMVNRRTLWKLINEGKEYLVIE